jgi:chromosome segregation protein
LNRAASRLHSLKELEAQFAGYGLGVQTLMKATELQSGFSGLLADSIETAPELEAAVEAALADRLQCIVCAGDAQVLRSLTFLKGQNGGRVGLALPLESDPLPPPVVAGATPLADRVKAAGPCSGLIRKLLSSVMLVDDIGRAIELARSHPTLSFVTPGGDMAAQGGIVTGGSTDQVQKGLIHKKREIKELEGQVATLEQEVVELGRERDELRRQSQETAEGLKGAGAGLHGSELKLAGLRKDRQQAADEIARIEERLAVQTLEADTLTEEKEALEAESKLSVERLAATGSASQELEQHVARIKAELDTRRGELTAVRERVTLIRVQAATLREQHEAHLRGLADLERQSQDLARRMTSDRDDTEKGGAERLQLQTAISTGSGRLEALLRQQLAAEARLAEIRAAYEAAGTELTAAELQARQCREESDAVRQSQAGLNLRFSTLSMQAEHLEQGLQEKSRITMAEALTRLEAVDFDETARRGRQVELQRLLDEMGEVNLMAIDEYAGMEERFSFLSAQKEDLEESLRSLQQAIQRINRTTRQRFQETYDLVNAKFQEVFPRLFCGGRAELRLTNEEDLLETGIDIIVQPPGKKLQNVTLLSGGEKALTAVALIFSIFLIKPTPFCLLDEVDAPLDDANIGRFNDMVREMSAVSQFIIITHNKATMLVADTLYGITMEEPGASKVVSVRLH